MTPTLIEFPKRGNLALTPEYDDGAPRDADRRAHKRLSGDEVPWLAGIRLKYGPAVRVIDVSRGGAQIETLAHRLNPGAMVVCEIAADGKGLVVPAQVVRCQIAQLLPEPSYRGSIAFKRPLELPGLQLAADAPPPAFHPVHEHARLVRALRRRAERRGGTAESSCDQSFIIGGDALTAALGLLHTPAGRRAGETFSRELALLFRTLANGVEADFPASTLAASLESRLTHAIGLRAARLAVSTIGPLPAESLCFDIPAAGAQLPRKLLVEFRERQELAEWHFHLLRAAVHLFALVRELDVVAPMAAAPLPPEAGRGDGRADAPAQRAEPSGARPVLEMAATTSAAAAEPVPVAQAAAPAPGAPREAALPAKVARVVVRYTDARLLKGYSREFNPANGYIEVWPTLTAPPEARIRVPFGALKAIFFVRDFDGNPNRVDATVVDEPRTDPRRGGRPITVTFLDDEVLAGTTMNYQVEGPGFFVTPLDDGANNERVFVLSRAIRHVRFG